jgi:hypothetical protein
MVYPVFTIDSIAKRCQEDIDEFIQQEGISTSPNFTLITDINALTSNDNLVAAIKLVKDFIESSLPTNTVYVHAISGITDKSIQNNLWIARTYLFYQLMIFAVVILGSNTPDLYNSVFGTVSATVFPFRQNFAGELKNYQMGIFGSKTPTSDIDVGIQYIGTEAPTSNYVPALAYIISTFENLFIAFTGKSSLEFDIEPYADMYLYKGNGKDTKDEKNTGDGNFDYFYLDTSTFTEADFKQILPIAGQSIARNVLMDNQALDTSQLTYGVINDIVNSAVMSNNKFNDQEKSYANFGTQITDTGISAALNDPKWLMDSIAKMKTFLQSDYNSQRAQYYQAVDAAENLKFKVAPTFSHAQKLNNSQKCQLILAFGEALSYRMESYTASPTITYVVRILQAGDKTKYVNIKPKEYCANYKPGEEPFCVLGKYGFVITILEQMGYMYRFYQHYCVGGHIDQAKCEKKIEKYGKRFVSAIQKYKELELESSAIIPNQEKDQGKYQEKEQGKYQEKDQGKYQEKDQGKDQGKTGGDNRVHKRRRTLKRGKRRQTLKKGKKYKTRK